IQHYEDCRQLHLRMYRRTPQVMNLANIYLLASLALSRSHASAGNAVQSKDVALECLETIKEFPDALKSTQAYRDNRQELEKFADPQ
ncbi:MAG: hypothetical protein AAFP69_23140, partial [Planctomycetota bacterium]